MRYPGWTIAAAVMAVLGIAGFAAPAVAQRGAPIALELAAASLDAGDYIWRDDDPAIGDVAVVINRATQVAYVYRGTRLVGVASVSTGKPGKRTPLGEFTILQKRVFHRSNLYSNAPMPYMQRLTWDGIALHAGHNPGYPASHGCIRLPRGFAMLLYGATRMGASVAVIDDTRTVPVAPRVFPLVIVDTGWSDDDGFAEVTWQAAGIGQGLYPAIGLRVTGDERMVPDARLLAPARRL